MANKTTVSNESPVIVAPASPFLGGTIPNPAYIGDISVEIPKFAALDISALESLAQTAGCTLYAPIGLTAGAQVYEVWGKGKESRMGENPRMLKAYTDVCGVDGLGGYLVAQSFNNLDIAGKRCARMFQKTGTFNMRTSGNAGKVNAQIVALGAYADLFGVRIDGSAKLVAVSASDISETGAL